MSDAEITLLSVRADSTLEVPPDEATLWCTVTAIETDKAVALRLLGERTRAATTALAELGGVARAARDARHALSWLLRSTRSESEMRWDERSGTQERTGRVIGTADLIVSVRDLALLDRVGDALSGVDELHMQSVSWSVDDDNPAWPVVRAAAIEAALRKGRDYAAALGGAILRVEHVADVGLLGDARPERAMFREQAVPLSYSADADMSGPSLDPVPQELRAGIDARFTASVRPVQS